MIIAEVLQGTANPREFGEYQAQMRALHYVATPRETWEHAARISFDLRRIGQTTQLSDLVIAAAAIENNLSVYTIDSDFDRVPGLQRHRP
jgi:predicted nucleic acid-binding protein